MCSIGGLCSAHGALPSDLVMQMLTKTLHRGKEGPTIVKASNTCTLGHTRLAIVGGHSNTQPLAVDGKHITFNGEVYNYLDLRTDLINKGRRFKTHGDAEVILNAYIVYGLSFAEKLRGIFSFAIYDEQTTQLILCRDRVGVKPLYYCIDTAQGTLAFASEVKALLGTVIDKQDVAVDYDSLCQYLHFQHCLGDRTMFRGIRKVLPGEMLIYNTSTIDIRTITYWSLNPAIVRNSSDDYYTEHYYKDRILSVLSRIIREQASHGLQAGAYVSGGLDSSTIAALLIEYVPDLIAVTGFYKFPKYDETAYAFDLVRSFQTNKTYTLNTIDISLNDVIANLRSAIYHLDEPCVGPGLIGQYVTAMKIKQQYPSLKVMYGGQGGDELFGGYSRYAVAYLESCIHGAIYPNKSRDYVMTLERLAPIMPVLQGYEGMLQDFMKKGMFGDRDRRYFELIGRNPDNQLSNEFKGTFYDKAKPFIFDEFLNIFGSLGGVSYFTKMTHFDFKASLPALLQVDDRVNGAFEMESRVPFLDEELIELAFSIPPAYKFSGGFSKGLLRKTMAGVVPDSILGRRDKMGFPVPFNEWLKQDSTLKDYVVSALDNPLHDFVFGKWDKDAELVFDRSMWGRLSLSLWQANFNIGV